MWQQTLFVLPLLIFAKGIRVPVDNEEEPSTETPVKRSDPNLNTPVYYLSDDAQVDSYLVPPDPNKPEVLSDVNGAPATFLLPPSPNKQTDYYYDPNEPADQTDWYPIAQAQQSQESLGPIPIFPNLNLTQIITVPHNNRKGKAHDRNQVPISVPATELEPPSVSAPNDFYIPTSEELQIQIENKKQAASEAASYELPSVEIPTALPVNYRPKLKPTLALHLIPPQPNFSQSKTPTNLYPKKFSGEFKPVPIPIAQYADESASEIPRAKPAKLFKPLPSTEIDYLTPNDEKINYLYRKAEHKRKLKGEKVRQELPSDDSIEDDYIRPDFTQQETSGSIIRPSGVPGRNAYPAPLRQAPPAPAQNSQSDISSAPAPDERTEFRMHGMKGPHSYQFGYDTGKGKNRQFRYEERDNDGIVRGHYGYMDKHGKLRVVNYSADPKTGFQADTPAEKSDT